MMHLNEATLNDYADRTLGAEDRAAADAHLTACPACTAELYAIAALKSRLADLPRVIPPERDLRAGAWQRIERAARPSFWSLRYPLAAAAVLLIAVTAVVTTAIVDDGPGGITGRAPADIRLVGAEAAVMQQEYTDRVAELQAILRKSRGTLSPETVRILEENLKIINAAIDEAQTALAADPNSDMLVDLLRSAYERKLELLRQAARSSPAT